MFRLGSAMSNVTRTLSLPITMVVTLVGNHCPVETVMERLEGEAEVAKRQSEYAVK